MIGWFTDENKAILFLEMAVIKTMLPGKRSKRKNKDDNWEKKKMKKLEESHERTISPNSNTSKKLLLWARREKIPITIISPT